MAGDFDEDGNQDLLTVTIPNNGNVTVVYGNGTGTFTSPVAFPGGSMALAPR